MTVHPSGVEDLIGQLGVIGKYQMRQHVLHFITAFLAGIHMFSLTFVAPTPQHRCLIPQVDSNSTNWTTFSTELLSEFIPLKNGELDSCNRFLEDNSISNSNITDEASVVSCGGQFVYDTSIYQQSRVYDWDMVCENKWMRAFIQSIYVFGVFNGALFCGSLADRFGRKTVLCVSGLLQFAFAVVQPYVTNYVVYCVTLFFYGMFGSAGAFVTGYVLCMELVHKSTRAYCGAIFNSSFSIGACLVALYGYLIRDISVLQTVFALHALLLFGYWWLLDESIRWLWSQGRTLEAISIVHKATRINGLPFTTNYTEIKAIQETKELQEIGQIETSSCKWEVDQPQPPKQKNHTGFSAIFLTPTVRVRAIITSFNWFATALCYYGISFNTGALPGDPYLVFFISAVAELPGFFLVTLIVNRTGRRPLNVVLLFVGGMACILISIIPRGWILTTIAMVAKMALAGCYAVIYNFTAELFPTVIRNSAIGLCSMSARLGGMLTPQITLLNSLDKSIPALVFGGVAICAAFAALFLPETLNKDLPQTLEDGKNYGKGDTAFSSCFKRKNISPNGSASNGVKEEDKEAGEKMIK